MATFRSDRERRMLGDRVVSRKDAFVAVHPAVAEVHAGFADAHGKLQAAIATRDKETGDAQKARDARDDEVAKSNAQYAWAYNELHRIMAPSWDAKVDEDLYAKTVARLFPLGPPATVGATSQLVLDGMKTFVDRVAHEQGVQYPPAFLQAARAGVAAVTAHIAKVNKEADEASAATDAHQAARDKWDTHHQALLEITTGFLRLKDDLGQLNVLFQDIPVSAAAGIGGSQDAPAAAPPPAGVIP
ncbi:MAG: hypothetical protein HY904_20390 [Deltaproteobacteria bacterium]|nr:hypothetical protein [Deltaproteobacteria bacterium]